MEENKKYYNLSNPQKSIWLTEQHYINTNVGNIVGILDFKENINIELLKEAVNLVVEKNEALRTGFIFLDGELKQFIKDFESFNIDILEMQNPIEYIKEFSNIQFDMEKDMLFHFEIIKLNNNTIKLISRFHHIITDAWSLSLIISEIVEIYTKLQNKTDMIDKYYGYSNYIEDEKKYIVSDKYFKDQSYWNEIYDTEPQILNFKKIENKNIANAKRFEYVLEQKISDKIKTYCKENNISTYCFFLTCLQLYISKGFNIEDVIIGNPFLNRKNHKERQSIGMYVNTLPIRLKTDYEKSIKELLKENNTIIRNTLKHEQYPYNDILEYVKDKYNINQNLYNVLFSYQNAQDNRKDTKLKYSTQWVFNNNISDNLEMHIHDRDDNGTFNIVYDYQENVFTNNQIDKLNKRYSNIINQLLSGKKHLVKDIEIISKEEKNKILDIYNDTYLNFSKERQLKSVYNVILNNNKHKSNNIALEENESKITYKELFERVNKLANLLKEKFEIKENENIGIITDKSIDTIIRNTCNIKNKLYCSSNRSELSDYKKRIYDIKCRNKNNTIHK